jgi:nicotinate-nucleotide adenylyltransferase
MRIGIFGGSFDPPHIGHITIARLSVKKFNLDKLIIVPAGNPPHKDKTAADGLCRYDMCEAVAKSCGFEISDYEIKKHGFCYTADTMEHFAKVFPECELYFIVGGDSINYMDKWKDPQRIFAVCSIIAALRKGTNKEKAMELKNKYKARIFWIDNKNIDISSTQIRNMIFNGGEISELVTKEVKRYIEENKLYR